MSKGEGKKLAIGAAVAGVAGYLAGILTAPKSGKETRQDVKNTAVKARTEAEKQLKRLHNELTSVLETAKKGVLRAKNVADKDFDKAVEVAVKAKDKAREMLTSIHEGGSDDKDLERAIEEANAAVNHLKSFLVKK